MNSQIIKEVLRREGGAKLTKDPDDPGGTTKYGISKRANPDVDVENLTEDEAVLIYLDKYWKPSKVSSLILLNAPVADFFVDTKEIGSNCV